VSPGARRPPGVRGQRLRGKGASVGVKGDGAGARKREGPPWRPLVCRRHVVAPRALNRNSGVPISRTDAPGFRETLSPTRGLK
jgi:hypothetical protein